ncbi:MAG: phospholipase D family protein [Clostridia bacterium]|nr:phospholipase D family protein [Clostridia bacterium]
MIDDLFSELDKPNYLHCVIDNKPSGLTFADIFNSNKYTSIKAVTFSASSSLVEMLSNRFEDVEIVIGIEGSTLAESYIKCLTNTNRVKEFETLSKSNQEKIKSGAVKFYEPLKKVHSKIYLLKGAEDILVLVGSANASNTALRSFDQFEELVGWTNNQAIFEIYQKRFEEIKNYCIPYYPNIIISEEGSKTADHTVGKNKKGIPIEEKAFDEIMTALGAQEVLVTREQVEDDITSLETNIKSRTTEIETLKIIKEAIPKTISSKQVINLKSIMKKVAPKIMERKLTVPLLEDQDDLRREMFYDKEKNTLNLSVMDGIVKPLHIGTMETNKRALEAIVEFCDLYKEYTDGRNEEVATLAMECMLYGLFSPLVWKLRQDNDPGVRRDIPIGLLLIGETRTGKSRWLRFFNALIGNSESHLFTFNKPPFKAKRADMRMKNLMMLYESKNLFPILIDEIKSDFFSASAVEEGIKGISNDLDTNHPVIIGTLNEKQFMVPEQVMNRLYLIRFDRQFDESRKLESETRYNTLIQTIGENGPVFFYDFLIRMLERLHERKYLYNPIDFLEPARFTMLEYFKELQVEVPKWFPKGKVDSYSNWCRKTWETIFLLADKRNELNYFKEKSGRSFFTFYNMEFIIQNIKSRNPEEIVSMLPANCKKQPNPLSIYCDAFAEYLEIPLNSEGRPVLNIEEINTDKKSILKRISRILGF